MPYPNPNPTYGNPNRRRGRRRRPASAGFGGGLGTALVRRRAAPKKLPASRPQAPRITPPRTPAASDINLQPGTLSGGMAAGYDINSDPAVAAAQGLAGKIRAQAQARALAKREQAAIEYGDPTGVTGISEKSSTAARENPFSVLKNLDYSYKTGLRDLEEGLNSANLFYSGYRGQQLGEAARGYEQGRYTAGTNYRALQSDISDQLSEALLNADMYEQNALLGSSGGGYDGGGYDGGGQVGPQLYAGAMGAGPRGPYQTDPGRPTPRRRRSSRYRYAEARGYTR